MDIRIGEVAGVIFLAWFSNGISTLTVDFNVSIGYGKVAGCALRDNQASTAGVTDTNVKINQGNANDSLSRDFKVGYRHIKYKIRGTEDRIV